MSNPPPTERPSDRTVRGEWEAAAQAGHEWPCREVGGAEDCEGAGCHVSRTLTGHRYDCTLQFVGDPCNCDAAIVQDTAQPKPQDER